ncbi:MULTISPECIES: xylulokinase [Gordonia]|jgi:xylulokinase|uniref:Xylulose kinase n=1 Tax=Gordonia aquimaris TaxID=2984863 RepID=A0A9X3D4F4_9ACTN|nr:MULTISPECIES: FGGY family carbohydrate kinase [Gordonia]MAU80376.1 xylulose kinase [Gordonia sp. (in: high G+C Gram-positive bacteria)]MCX2964264.1 FGGY family carbohydrate kinase [Gordonia aquimaris]
MTLVAGVDSSTQSCKVVICDADSGHVVRTGAAAHPPGTAVDPEHWWKALQDAIATAGGIDDVSALSIAGQQHGLICLDRDGAVLRDALLWNDNRSASSARTLIGDFGGASTWADRVGVVPVASITASKLRWVADNEPEVADATAAVCLPHDWLTWRLLGATDLAELRTDRSDASGTGYYSAATGDYCDEVFDVAFGGRRPMLPRVLGPAETAGVTAHGCVIGAGAGDNAAAALGLMASAGDCIVSLGTSGVVSAVTETPPRDASGLVAGFADASGRQLPLVCTLNGAPVLAAAARMLGVGLDDFGALALSAEPGADGLTMVPYLAGERTPNLPDATGSLAGITADNWTPANVARASVEGLLCSLVYCLDLISRQGVDVDRIVMVGGGARSAAVREIAPGLFGRAVHLPEPGEYVARGAARQAAWALTGVLPRWPVPTERREVPHADPATYRRYRAVTDLVVGR